MQNTNQSCRLTSEKTALVVEGGAMRGIFSTGVLDSFIQNNFNPFDLCVGVSAGSTNIAAYLAHMYKRNYTIYTDYSLRKEFISLRKFILGKHLVDLDWLWDISIREYRLDLETILSQKSQFRIGLTNVETGTIEYFVPQKENLEDLLKASSALPVFYRGFVSINNTLYADGGVSDPIPVMEAVRQNATKILVIRSRPYGKTLESKGSQALSAIALRKYPKLVEAIRARVNVYAQSLQFLRNPPKGISIIEVNPPDDFLTERLTKDKHILDADYRKGIETGIRIMKKWK